MGFKNVMVTVWLQSACQQGCGGHSDKRKNRGCDSRERALGPPKESAFEREWGKLRRATQYLTFLLGGCYGILEPIPPLKGLLCVMVMCPILFKRD